LNIADRHFSSKLELSLLALMFRVKVPRLVFPIVHPDHDAEEDRNDRHESSIASSTDPVGPTLRFSGGAQRCPLQPVDAHSALPCPY